MEFFIHWVSNIIVYILVATIIMMLIPNSGLAKYVRFVASLLLIVMMLQPIFQLFKVNIKEVLAGYQSTTYQANNEIKNEINNKKSEIQEAERAYILKQMAVQMKKEVEKSFTKEFEQVITNVDLQVKDGVNTVKTAQDLSKVTVYVSPKKDETSNVEPVQEVSINTDQPVQTDDEKIKQQELQTFLANKWELEDKQIEVKMEGGE
ncbi:MULTISPECIES: stage III sporulation protein AF [unclassified Bacillus (in: firmicutes)]|uniref:stage III sporulation protein AF n=1 Tax=unclassified Bacillus (in: firmicutes) TaxID=185979 RepID=UPI000BF0CDB3|nr:MULTISPECIES: stage III sporulation protein AF [unclassified Bacillus (in: firmicutes)]PEJ56997.1 stage III sporulation protein AF [Bacillus sp. AFS002410]PEL11270.1 stage III sporulation protein AF [Bacillus sp. AFS017336]